MEISFPGIESYTDLINLISVILSDDPDAAIIAREVMYTSNKQNLCTDKYDAVVCGWQKSQDSLKPHFQDQLFDFKNFNCMFYVGNITEDMIVYKENKSMMNSFCNDKRDKSTLVDFISDSAVQDFLHFYKYSKKTFSLCLLKNC